ncbi:MAG: Polygalacturonase [Paenibacillaceae bacterium]|jgi:polygalacturonase|nr:Polygalacturonase [Paenibacillaceae bacterium]
MYNILDYGARSTRLENNAASIQAAIDACAANGGGVVYIPPGDYLSGAIELASRVNLYLEAGATLWASPDPAHYMLKQTTPSIAMGALIRAEQAEDIGIMGPGRIHGTGVEELPLEEARKLHFRIAVCVLEQCRQVNIRQIQILYSDAWTLHLLRCENVFIEGITIANNRNRLNSDGIDPDCCRNVHISNCRIQAGDDCIVFKTTQPYPCENITVTNCTFDTPCAAIKLGTESLGSFSDILVSNCVIRNSHIGIGFFIYDGGRVERVQFSNMTIETMEHEGRGKFPIFMDIERRFPDSPVGSIRDVIFRDIQIASRGSILLQGMEESRMENIAFSHVTQRVTGYASFHDRRKPVASGRRQPQTERSARDVTFAAKEAYFIAAYVDFLEIDGHSVHIPEEVDRLAARSIYYIQEQAQENS